MKVGDEDPLQVSDSDPRGCQTGVQGALGLRGVQSGVDEGPASVALDEVNVDDLEREREGERDETHAGRGALGSVHTARIRDSGPFV